MWRRLQHPAAVWGTPILRHAVNADRCPTDACPRPFQTPILIAKDCAPLQDPTILSLDRLKE